MKRAIAIAACALVLAACGKPAEHSTPAGVGFNVDRLFTHDGCTVYRFGDAGEYRYFTKCEGAASSNTTWSETRPCGKSQCRDAREIPTAYGRSVL